MSLMRGDKVVVFFLLHVQHSLVDQMCIRIQRRGCRYGFEQSQPGTLRHKVGFYAVQADSLSCEAAGRSSSVVGSVKIDYTPHFGTGHL